MLKLTTIVHEEAAATKKLLEEIGLKQAPSQYYGRLLYFLQSLCDEVIELTNSISEYLLTTANPQQMQTLRTWLILGSYTIRQINSYCDSFEYAGVLSVPSATMQILNKLFRTVTKSKEFMVRGTTELNYMYQPIGVTLNNLASHFPGSTPKLEDSFAILLFPIAYSKNLMANCNLVHELGHLIVDSNKLTNRLENVLEVAKKRQIAEIIEHYTRPGEQYDFQSAQRRVRINRILQNWIHEVMADFIGILLLGPCHLLAFMKQIEPLGSHQKDDDEHPCSASRIGMMVEALEELKWDDIIRRECSQTWERAVEISSMMRETHELYDAAAECLPLIKEDILKVAKQSCRKYVYEPKTFMSAEDSVYGLLEQGIPPAEKIGKSSTPNKFDSIDAVSIINGGWFFYEKGYPMWEKRYSNFGLDEKAEFLNRLLAKAMEITFVQEAVN